MTRMTAKDFAPELLELYDYCAHGRITKREFLDRAATYTVGGITAAMVLAQLSPNYALAQQVAATDPEIKADYITYPSPQGHGEVRGYLARPAGAKGKLGAVVVVHENPRAEPLYRGCRAPCRQGGVYRAGARRVDLGRGLSGQ